MRRRTPARHACQRDDRGRHDRDPGVSLIEILIAIVLLGTVVTAVLTALRTTTTASAIDEEHAIAFAWLQAASDEVYRAPRVSCDPDPAAPISPYNDAANQPSIRPSGWEPATMEVVTVEYLGRERPDDEFEWDATHCFEGDGFEDSPLYTQRVSLQATTPDGLVKTLQMVKSEG